MPIDLTTRRDKTYIPTELLLRIFTHFMAYNSNKSDALIRLSLVCRQWQDITHHHCKFWLELVGLDIPESFLAKILPQSFSPAVSLSYRPRTSQFPEIVASNLCRIDSLDLLIPFSLRSLIINTFNTPAPYLRNLTLTLRDGVSFENEDAQENTHVLPATLFNRGAPLLNSLTLLGFNVPLSPTVFRGMHSINLGPWNPWFGPQYPLLPLLDALRNAPSMEIIILADCVLTTDSNLSPDFIVHFPYLKILDLTGVSSDILTLVLALSLPPSCKIKLWGRTEGDYDRLLTTFMRSVAFPATHSMKLNVEATWGRIDFGLEANDASSKLQASFPDADGHLLVIASTFIPMQVISEISVTGDGLPDISLAWWFFLISCNRVRTLSLSGRSALDLLLALSALIQLGTVLIPMPQLSILHLVHVDFGMPTDRLNMTLADLVLRCLDQPRRRSMTLTVERSRTTKQVLASILESVRHDVELEWDGEEEFSDTESLVSEGDE